MPRVRLPIALIALIAPALAVAQDLTGDPGRGGRLAVEVCAACHAVKAKDFNSRRVAAPAFQELADNPELNPINLRVLLQTPHREMPDLILNAEETDDVIAYILGLR